MRSTLIALATAGMLVAGAAQAQSGADLLKSKNCLNCHDVDKKKVGPALKDIAAKHKGSKEAAAMLVAKLKEGKGHLKVAASDAELKSLVQTVLATK